MERHISRDGWGFLGIWARRWIVGERGISRLAGLKILQQLMVSIHPGAMDLVFYPINSPTKTIISLLLPDNPNVPKRFLSSTALTGGRG